MSKPDDWERALRRQREQKDEFLAEHPRSPLAAADQEAFDGLNYFPPDPGLRFELPLVERDDPEPLSVETTTGDEQRYLRWGEFTFELGGAERTLQAYRSDPEEERLWVPFRDRTSGEETYGGGRYLDLEPEDRLDDAWVLDFNRAYNPYCAYNDAYECPLVPAENWLDVRIEAGEKRPELTGHVTDH